MNQTRSTTSTYQYQSFLIRLWQDSEDAPWRVSTTHVTTGEQLFFDNLESLFIYLSRQTKTAVLPKRNTTHNRIFEAITP